MGEQIVITNFWQMRELEDAQTDELVFGTIGPSAVADITETEIHPDAEQLSAILEIGEIGGEYEQVRWLYYSVQSSISILFDNYQLQEDGVVDMPDNPMERYTTFIAIDALFHSVVVFAKRFIDKAEYLLKHRFGNDSAVYTKWKSQTKYAYDNSMAYALMYDLRNCVEHEFWTVSIVNYDMKNHHKAGLAINVDNDLLNHKNARMEQRLREWARERANAGEPAWLSLGKCVGTYRGMIKSMYDVWLVAYIERASQHISRNKGTLAKTPGNLLIWRGNGTIKHSATGQPRAYHITDVHLLRSLIDEHKAIEESLAALGHETSENTKSDS